jgi:P4 family phage/plasmid primase-like protien
MHQFVLDTAAYDAAIAWYQAGACVLPAATDGSKRPGVGQWKEYQDQRPSSGVMTTLLPVDVEGIGLLCGKASGGLEMLELEGVAVEAGLAEALIHLIGEVDKGLITALMTYMEKTPSGGLHWIYRCAEVGGNTKLASQPREPTADNPSRVRTLIETRGEGGWTVLAPSAGRTHPTGKAWEVLVGTPGVVGEITPEQREMLFDCCRALDQMPPPPPIAHRPPVSATEGLLTPGQDYEARTTWEEILEPLGWRKLYNQGEKIVWQRPGKKGHGAGPSATTNYDGNDNLYVFTTSTEFMANASYTKFAAYTLIHHGEGKYSEAARELRAAGYGSPSAPATLTMIVGGGTPAAALPTSGSAAMAPATEESSSETLLHSEDGHAQMLIGAHGHELRYCVELGKWLAWDGTVWRVQQPEGMAREYAKEVARTLPVSNAAEVKFKMRCLSAMGTTGCLRQAMTDMRVVVAITALDNRPRELNTPNGVLDLPSKMLLPPDPSHMHTKVTFCAPDFSADRSAWMDFLMETFGGDLAMISYVQQLIGYAAVGEVGPHILPFCWGSGGNGKGVFLETILELLGDYGDTSPANFLMAGLAKHETEIAALAGKRMIVSSEINEDDRFDEAKVKSLTGGDMLRGRFMRRDHFTFKPSHTLFLVGNAEPTVKAGGRGFWRRLRKIPFLNEVAIPIDRLKDDFVANHGPAIMAWIAEGAASYFANGLVEPDVVVNATQAYRDDQDTVGKFVAEHCRLGGGELVTVPVARVRQVYESWVRKELGVDPVSPKRLTMDLNKMGVGTARTKSTRFYTSITILNTEEDSSEPTQESWFDR